MIGVSCALLSAIFSSSKDFVSKKVSFNVDGTTSAFASFFFALPYYVLALAVAYLFGKETLAITAGFGGYVLARSLTDVCAEWCKMNAFACGDLSLVVLFLSLTPLMLLVTSPIITGDPLSPVAVISTILVVTGSLTIAYRPGRSNAGSTKKAVIFALAAAIFFSLNNCFDRLAVQTASPLMAGFAMTTLAALFLFPLLFLRRKRVGMLVHYRGPFLLRGFFEIGFMVSKLSALQFMSAPYVDSIMRTSLLLSILGGRLYFKEQDIRRRLIAGVLILCGSLIVIWAQI